MNDDFDYENEDLYNKCIHLIEEYPKLSSYHYIGNDVQLIFNTIQTNHEQDGLERFNKNLLLRLIEKNSIQLDKSELPLDIVDLYKMNFNRIEKEIKTQKYLRPYLYTNDKFRKDIAVCSMKLIPVGAYKIHKCNLPRYFLLRGGIKQFLKGIAFFTFELKGRKPVFQAHLDTKDPDLLKELNEDGMKRTFIRIAELIKRNSSVKGVYGTGWLFDPVLDNISPWLSYYRKIIVDNGGKNFHIGNEESAVANATMKSKTRKRLYEEGKYLPKNYMFIWARKKLIKWSDSITNKI